MESRRLLIKLCFGLSLFHIGSPLLAQECDVIWTSLTNTEVSGDTLRKLSGASSGWNADARSVQSVKDGEDGFFIYEVHSSNNSQQIGFADNDATAGFSDIDFGFYFTYNPSSGSRYVDIKVHGSSALNAGQYNVGDLYRVKREGDTMYFDKNTGSGWVTLLDTLAYLPSASTSLPEIFVDNSIFYVNATIINTKISCPSFYAKPLDKVDGSYYQCLNGTLKLEFLENYSSSSDTLSLTIYDKSRNIEYQNTLNQESTGVNLIDIDLKATGNFTVDDFYMVEVVDKKDNKKYLRIKYLE
jgi:hypothetical protein